MCCAQIFIKFALDLCVLAKSACKQPGLIAKNGKMHVHLVKRQCRVTLTFISTAIRPLPQFQVRQLSVAGKIDVHKVLVMCSRLYAQKVN